MTRETKVFEASFDDVEPYPFTVQYTNRATGAVAGKETFEAQGNPGAGFQHVVLSIVQVIDGKQVTDANGVYRFFKRVLLGDGYDRLLALLDNQDVVVPLEGKGSLSEIMDWLVGEYTARPTTGPSA